MENTTNFAQLDTLTISAEAIDKALSGLGNARHQVQVALALSDNVILDITNTLKEYSFATAHGKEEFKRACSLGHYRNHNTLVIQFKLDVPSEEAVGNGDKVNTKGRLIKAKIAKVANEDEDRDTKKEAKKAKKNKKLRKENKQLNSALSARNDDIKALETNTKGLLKSAGHAAYDLKKSKEEKETLIEQIAGKNRAIERMSREITRLTYEIGMSSEIYNVLAGAIKDKEFNRTDLKKLVG